MVYGALTSGLKKRRKPLHITGCVFVAYYFTKVLLMERKEWLEGTLSGQYTVRLRKKSALADRRFQDRVDSFAERFYATYRYRKTADLLAAYR